MKFSPFWLFIKYNHHDVTAQPCMNGLVKSGEVAVNTIGNANITVCSNNSSIQIC